MLLILANDTATHRGFYLFNLSSRFEGIGGIWCLLPQGADMFMQIFVFFLPRSILGFSSVLQGFEGQIVADSLVGSKTDLPVTARPISTQLNNANNVIKYFEVGIARARSPAKSRADNVTKPEKFVSFGEQQSVTHSFVPSVRCKDFLVENFGFIGKKLVSEPHSQPKTEGKREARLFLSVATCLTVMNTCSP